MAHIFDIFVFHIIIYQDVLRLVYLLRTKAGGFTICGFSKNLVSLRISINVILLIL